MSAQNPGTRTDCSAQGVNSACAPYVENDIVSDKAYVCVPNDAHAWTGCHSGAGSCCPSNYDCLEDKQGNRFCSRICSNNAQCGNTGTACCNTAATCQNCLGGCSTGGCMPCP